MPLSCGPRNAGPDTGCARIQYSTAQVLPLATAMSRIDTWLVCKMPKLSLGEVDGAERLEKELAVRTRKL